MNATKQGFAESLRTTFKYTAILISFFMVVLMMWESQKSDAALAETAIPKESIRLRILANSDAPGDQLVKRQIRDAIVEQMNRWVAELENPQSLEQARGTIRTHLPELNALVGSELAKRGISYGYKVELGIVPFPTKMYGGTVYPAGDYEALRVTLGKGEGQNWWCVLFPPLCFIDAGSGDAAAAPAADVKQDGKSGGQVKAVKASAAGAGAVTGAAGNAADKGAETPEVRFFVVDLLAKIWSWICSLFS